jgi:hypothetical protein
VTRLASFLFSDYYSLTASTAPGSLMRHWLVQVYYNHLCSLFLVPLLYSGPFVVHSQLLVFYYHIPYIVQERHGRSSICEQWPASFRTHQILISVFNGFNSSNGFPIALPQPLCLDFSPIHGLHLFLTGHQRCLCHFLTTFHYRLQLHVMLICLALQLCHH